LQDFVELLENCSRVVNLDQMSLQVKGGGEDEEASMSARMGLSSFFVSPPDETKIDTPITLDLDSQKFRNMVERIEELKQYEVTVEKGDIGKENPFVE